MTTLVPYLTLGPGDATLRLLTEGLGFEVVTEQRAADGAISHIELRRGDAIVMGGSGEATIGTSPGLYLVVDDVDGLYEAALTAGARPGYPPEDTEWGTRRAEFTDPDGHEWSIGTYQPGSAW